MTVGKNKDQPAPGPSRQESTSSLSVGKPNQNQQIASKQHQQLSSEQQHRHPQSPQLSRQPPAASLHPEQQQQDQQTIPQLNASSSRQLTSSTPELSPTMTPHTQLVSLSPSTSTTRQESEAPVLKLERQTKRSASNLSGGPSGPNLSQQQLFVDGEGAHVRASEVDRAKKTTSRRLSAWRIFTIDDSVQVFYISPDGTVRVTSDTTSLNFVRLARSRSRVAIITEPGKTNVEPHAFLQAGDWLYPLIPGCSPVLITAFGTYVFPDLQSSEQGAAVALALPQYVSIDEREEFEILLDYYANVEDSVDRVGMERFKDKRSRSAESSLTDTTNLLSDNPVSSLLGVHGLAFLIKMVVVIIVIGINLLTSIGVWLIRQVAQATRAAVHRASRAHEVDPHVVRGVLYAKSATDQTVVVTGHIVQTLQEATVKMSVIMTPRPSMIDVLPDFLHNPASAVGHALRLTAVLGLSAYGGMTEVYLSLGDAANTMFEVLSDETVKTVEYKYGDNYGNITREAFNTAYNMKKVIKHTNSIKSLAFLPMTIRAQVREKIKPEMSDTYIRIDKYAEKVKARYIVDKTVNPDGLMPFMTLSGSSVDHRSTEALRGKSLSTKSSIWSWMPSISTDQVTLAGSAIRTESDSSWFTRYARQSSSTDKTQELTPHDRSGLYRRKSDLKSPSSHQSSSAVAVNSGQRNTSTQRLVGSSQSIDTKPSTLSQSGTFVSGHGDPLAPTRRQSVFLSHRRQSMHVVHAMANAVDQQWEMARHEGAAAALVACADMAQQRDKFKAAAISITTAKIRRRHREKCTEHHLVVLQSSENFLRESDSSEGSL